MAEGANTREGVAAEVRAAMARQRVTQGELATRIGISRAALSERLSGQRPFDTDQLYAICTTLEIPFLSLFPDVAEAVSA